MIFDCPSCGAENGVPVSVIGEEGHILRCRRCKEAFRVFPPEDDDESLDGVPDARGEATAVAVDPSFEVSTAEALVADDDPATVRAPSVTSREESKTDEHQALDPTDTDEQPTFQPDDDLETEEDSEATSAAVDVRPSKPAKAAKKTKERSDTPAPKEDSGLSDSLAASIDGLLAKYDDEDEESAKASKPIPAGPPAPPPKSEPEIKRKPRRASTPPAPKNHREEAAAALSAIEPSVVIKRGPQFGSGLGAKLAAAPLAVKVAVLVFPLALLVTLVLRSGSSADDDPIAIEPAEPAMAAGKTAEPEPVPAEPKPEPKEPGKPKPAAKVAGLEGDRPAPKDHAFVQRRGVRIRVAPSSDGKVVAAGQAGQLVRVYDEIGEWSLVHAVPGGAAGFILGTMLGKKKPIIALADQVAFEGCKVKKSSELESCVAAAEEKLEVCTTTCQGAAPGGDQVFSTGVLLVRCEDACKSAFAKCQEGCKKEPPPPKRRRRRRRRRRR